MAAARTWVSDTRAAVVTVTQPNVVTGSRSEHTRTDQSTVPASRRRADPVDAASRSVPGTAGAQRPASAWTRFSSATAT